jgi:hypothetical protein
MQSDRIGKHRRKADLNLMFAGEKTEETTKRIVSGGSQRGYDVSRH